MTDRQTAEIKNSSEGKKILLKTLDADADDQQIFLLLKAEKGCDFKVVTSEATTQKSGWNCST